MPPTPEPTAQPGLQIEWAAAQTQYPGQALSGDGYLVQLTSRGALIALIDGLGHGPHAAAAAQAGLEALRAHAADMDPRALVMHCHRAMSHTRGGAMSLAVYDADAGYLTWLGVGNVCGIFLPDGATQQPRQHLVTQGGVVGYRMPSLYVSSLLPGPGDTLIFASDGVQSDFASAVPYEASPQHIADHVIQTYGGDGDDATICVVRFCAR